MSTDYQAGNYPGWYLYVDGRYWNHYTADVAGQSAESRAHDAARRLAPR